ncbi:MAG: alpha-hydroxy-acid oxidizing protein [Chloroflexi bacterium]|nr:alpha-hydroxy-acid oxidizing protein [Chloroflexota bacterium]
MTTQPTLLTIGDYEALARQTMPQALFDRLFGDLGAPDWIINTNNVQAMSEVKPRPRILVDVTERDMTTTVLGEEISMPVMLAPTSGPTPWASWLPPGPPAAREPFWGSAPPPATALRKLPRLPPIPFGFNSTSSRTGS